MAKRIFDIVFSLLGLLLLMPVLAFISILILLDSGRGIFFFQERVGRHGKDFSIIKFRTMRKESENRGLITIGNRDRRITGIGYYLRRFKLDELPQLLNIFTGRMSFVGPRPEVRKYLDLSDPRIQEILTVRPGLTSYASLEFMKVNEMLEASESPERTYMDEILPRKLDLNLQYLRDKSLKTDIRIIFKTLFLLFKDLK